MRGAYKGAEQIAPSMEEMNEMIHEHVIVATLKSIMRRELEAIAAVLPDRHQLPIDPRIEVGLLKVEKCRLIYRLQPRYRNNLCRLRLQNQLRQRHPELSAMEIKEKLLCIAEQKDVLDVSPYSRISSSAVVSVARGAGSRCPADSGADSTLNTFLFVLYVLAIVAVPTGAACLYARRVRKAAE